MSASITASTTGLARRNREARQTRKGTFVFLASNQGSRVIDREGRPIPNVSVYNSEYYWFGPKKPRGKTDKEGHFRISGVKPGIAGDRQGRATDTECQRL